MLPCPVSGWIRKAAAWLLAAALLLGSAPPVPVLPGADGPDSFVAADLCSTAHQEADPAKGGGTAHDCVSHCCVQTGSYVPPAPLSLRPLGLVVAVQVPPTPLPAPDEPSLSVHPARAPPFLAA
ncbi:hypothetical protein [Paramagnetospirillum magnetotacticum]|uniref:hypothetical protein n=1 Tax=Paramagnetospirillum magnetotacticum TaxID=188 RepID=UPI0000384A0E|nr:hypothetical protein [Paramagnetospirillum magnetotacticum]